MEKELIVNGSKIFYRVIGDGKPVMLIHGIPLTGDIWENQVEALKSDHRLIIPDLPGSGRSELVADMSMAGMAGVLKEMLDQEVIDKVSMIGHSLGGYITLAFAENYPGSLRSFGLFHSTSYADNEEKKANRRKGIEFARKHGAFEFLKTSTPNLFSPDSKQQNPGLVDEIIRGLHNFSTDTIVSYYEAMMQRPDRTEVLRTTNLPVLFVIGEHDSAVPPKDSLEQSHLPGISYIHILHQSGHMGMLEEKDKCNDLLQQFLSDT